MSNIGIALQFDAAETAQAALLSSRARLAREQGFDYLVWRAQRVRPQLIEQAQRETGVKVIAIQCNTDDEDALAACNALSIPDLIVTTVHAGRRAAEGVRVSQLVSSEADTGPFGDVTIHACVDVGEALLRGEDGPGLIRTFSGRSPLVLLQDCGEDSFAFLGTGRLDWEQIFDAGEEAGAEWYVVGNGSVDDDNPASLHAAYDFLVQRA